MSTSPSHGYDQQTAENGDDLEADAPSLVAPDHSAYNYNPLIPVETPFEAL